MILDYSKLCFFLKQTGLVAIDALVQIGKVYLIALIKMSLLEHKAFLSSHKRRSCYYLAGIKDFCQLKMTKMIFYHYQLKAFYCNDVKIIVWSSKPVCICCRLCYNTNISPNRLRLELFFFSFRNVKNLKLELDSGKTGPRFSQGLLWPIIVNG